MSQTGAEVARFEYDPFRHLTVDAYGNATSFPYPFSTKPQDGVTGLDYHGYRWFDPVTGRWPCRDPIGERGGVSLYGFVGNDGVSWWDYLGLVTLTIYDGQDEGWPGRANGQQHEKHPKETPGPDVDIGKAGVSQESIDLIKRELAKLREGIGKENNLNDSLEKGYITQEYYASIVGEKLKIMEIVIVGHGGPGEQMCGCTESGKDDFIHPGLDADFIKSFSALIDAECGPIVLRGSKVGRGEEGEACLQIIADMAQRSVVGYSVNTTTSQPEPEHARVEKRPATGPCAEKRE